MSFTLDKTHTTWKLEANLPIDGGWTTLWPYRLERTFSRDAGREAWMHNFAKIALEARAYFMANKKALALSEILKENRMILSESWSGAVAQLCKKQFDMPCTIRKNGNVEFGYQIMTFGQIANYSQLNLTKPEKLVLVCKELTSLAKNFSPSGRSWRIGAHDWETADYLNGHVVAFSSDLDKHPHLEAFLQ